MNKLYFVYDKVSEDVIMCGLAPTGGAFIRANARLAQSFNPNFETDFVVIETLSIDCFTDSREFTFADVDNYVLVPWSAYKSPDHPVTEQSAPIQGPTLPRPPYKLPEGVVKSE